MFLWGDMLGFYSSISLQYFLLTAGGKTAGCRNDADFHLSVLLPPSKNVYTDFPDPHFKQHSFQERGSKLTLLEDLTHVETAVCFTLMDTQQYQYSSEIPLRLPHAFTSRQAPADLLCCKAFLMHVLNESQRIDGLRIITFSRDRLSCTK